MRTGKFALTQKRNASALALLMALSGAPLLAVSAVPAHAQIATGVVAGVLLGDLQNKADHVIENAQKAGDFLIWRAAQQARALIDAWKAANNESINLAFDRLDDASKKVFLEVDRSLDRMDQERELAAGDAQRLTIQWAQIIKGFSLSGDAELLTYGPRVILPVGEQMVDLRLYGPRFADAKPVLKSEGGIVPLTLSTETEGLARIARTSLPFDKMASTRAAYRLEFTREGWFTSRKVERDVTVWLAPATMGEYVIKPEIKEEKIETSEITLPVGARGKDNAERRWVPLPPDKINEGWEIDVGRLINPRNGWIHDAGGDKGHCSYVDRNSITKSGFDFIMDIGHTTDNWGHKGDGFQNCKLDVPILKRTPLKKAADPIKGELGWGDLKVDLPPAIAEKLVSKTIEVKLFNGRSYVLTDAGANPLGLLSVDDRGSSVVFRPKPPSDF